MTSRPGEQDTRERLVREHAFIAEREAARYRTWRLDRSDLRQAGMLGLLIAAARFDPARAVPFAAYARFWVRKEIQAAISRQEFPAVLPADLAGRTVAVRRALDDHAGRLDLAAAALGISPATVAALRYQADAVGAEDKDRPVPGYALAAPEGSAIAGDFIRTARAALARMDPRRADALVLRYGLNGEPRRSFRQIGRYLGVSDHTARALVERAQADLRRLLD